MNTPHLPTTVKPSQVIAQAAENVSDVIRSVDQIPPAMRRWHFKRWHQVESLIKQHGLDTSVQSLTLAYRMNVEGRIYSAHTTTDIAKRPLGILEKADGKGEVELPIGLLVAVHDLVASTKRILSFRASDYLSPAIHRQGQRRNAQQGRPSARTREEKLRDIGKELKRGGWIAGKLKVNQDLRIAVMVQFECCDKDVRDAARMAGLTRAYGTK